MAFTATTLQATNIHSAYMTLNGVFTKDGGVSVKFNVQAYKEGDSPSAYDFPYCCYDAGTYNRSYLITPSHDLTPNTLYYFRWGMGGYEGGPIFGEWLSARTNPIIVTTKPATNVHATSADLKGSYTNDSDLYLKHGFQWKLGESGEVQQYSTPTFLPYGAGSFNFSYSKTGLTPNSIYYFRFGILGTTSMIWEWGQWNSFITGLLSIATTYNATEVGNIIATLNGKTTTGEDGPILESGFEWKVKNSSTYTVVKILDWGGETYNLKLIELEVDTFYCFKAYGKVNGRTFYGEVLEFTTTKICPIVTTQIAIDLEAMSVTGNGTIVNCGGLETSCSAIGFEVTYTFSGTLKEYNVWKSYDFTGNVILNSGTGLWEGTLTKTYEESGIFLADVFDMLLNGLVSNKTYSYRAKAENHAGWGYGNYLAFTTDELLLRKACTIGIWTILLCAYVNPIPAGSVIKRRGFRWGIYNTAQEYDIHEDGNFSTSAIIGPKTISFVCSNDDNVYDTIVDSGAGFLTAGFIAGKFIDVSATGALSIENEGQFKIISVTADTITVNVRNTLVSEAVSGVTIIGLFALYIVDLDPETDYYSVAYVAIEDSEGNWSVQEGGVAMATTIVNPFDFEGYDKVEFYKPEREQNYKRITREISAEIISEQQYIDLAGGRRFLDIKNHLIQTKANAVTVGTNYRNRFQEIKSLMTIEYPTPAPLQREDTLDIGFGRIRFKLDDKGVVNFMPDGEGLMLFRYRMVMMIRKNDMGYTISKDNVDYMATMELEEA